MRESTGERIKQIMSERNLKQVDVLNLAEPFFTTNSKLTKTDLSQYVNEKTEPRQDKLYILARALNVSEAWLMGFNAPRARQTKKENGDILSIYEILSPPRQEKVYDYAEHQLEQQKLEEESELYVVGQTAAGEPIEGQQAVPVVGVDTLMLYVNGDSMEPEFYDGDIVEYKPQPTLENGEIGVFAIDGGITMKKFRNNGDVRLQSLNDKYQDIVITEDNDFNILGKVLI